MRDAQIAAAEEVLRNYAEGDEVDALVTDAVKKAEEAVVKARKAIESRDNGTAD